MNINLLLAEKKCAQKSRALLIYLITIHNYIYYMCVSFPTLYNIIKLFCVSRYKNYNNSTYT